MLFWVIDGLMKESILGGDIFQHWKQARCPQNTHASRSYGKCRTGVYAMSDKPEDHEDLELIPQAEKASSKYRGKQKVKDLSEE